SAQCVLDELRPKRLRGLVAPAPVLLDEPRKRDLVNDRQDAVSPLAVRIETEIGVGKDPEVRDPALDGELAVAEVRASVGRREDCELAAGARADEGEIVESGEEAGRPWPHARNGAAAGRSLVRLYSSSPGDVCQSLAPAAARASSIGWKT